MAHLLARPGPAPVVLLSGEPGSGRPGFLAAAAAAARAGGASRSVRLLALDLAGLEDGDEGLSRYLEVQRGRRRWREAFAGPPDPAARARERERDRAWSARVDEVAERCWSLPASQAAAALLSLLLSLDAATATGLAGCVGPLLADLESSSRGALETLGRLIAALAEPASAVRLVVHCVASSQCSEPLRRWLLARSREDRGPVLFFSCHPRDLNQNVAPGAEVLRISFTPLAEEELRGGLQASFRPNRFPVELSGCLHRASRGSPPLAAELMMRLAAPGAAEDPGMPENSRPGALFRDAGGIWRLRTRGAAPAGSPFELEAALEEPLRGLLSRLPIHIAGRLERFLDLAALCGQDLPVDLLVEQLGLTALEREDILDLLDGELGEGSPQPLLRDLQYAHPGFPGLLTYSFLAPVPGGAWHDETCRGPGREMQASKLLARLRARLPVATRGQAQLALHLADQLPEEAERSLWSRLLAWWVESDETGELSRLLAADLAGKRLAVADLLSVAAAAERCWPPALCLAVLDALDAAAGARDLAPTGSSATGATPGPLTPLTPLNHAEEALHRLLRARALMRLGLVADALTAGEEALHAARSAFGPEDPRVGATLFELGRLELQAGRVEEARRHLAQAAALGFHAVVDVAAPA